MSDTSTEARVLKPCPFCGGEASDTGVIRYDHKHEAFFKDGTRITEAFFCNCISCGVTNRGMLGHQTREKAITAWNRRSELSGKDAERLDYLQQRGATVSIVRRLDADGYRLMFQIGGLHSAVDTNIRQAIDAAIESTTKEQS